MKYFYVRRGSGERGEGAGSVVRDRSRASRFLLAVANVTKQSEVWWKKTSHKIKFNAKFERRNFKAKYFCHRQGG
ncbi:hypothetical protein [uncultured Campylobacter sp.]|uniref:hypothetical protein n=1 Tax=uncultured Campylobacter sp. TaxID=218934 RepID=UPI002613ADAD|nr:hypothetical protein [uncultured Campylobacter sp.]